MSKRYHNYNQNYNKPQQNPTPEVPEEVLEAIDEAGEVSEAAEVVEEIVAMEEPEVMPEAAPEKKTGVTTTKLYIRNKPNGDKVDINFLPQNLKENCKSTGDGIAILEIGTKVDVLRTQAGDGRSQWIEIADGKWLMAVSVDGETFVQI